MDNLITILLFVLVFIAVIAFLIWKLSNGSNNTESLELNVLDDDLRLIVEELSKTVNNKLDKLNNELDKLNKRINNAEKMLSVNSERTNFLNSSVNKTLYTN